MSKNYWDSDEEEEAKPILKVTPYAWAKMLFFRDKGTTEIGGYGVSDPDNLLLIRDFITVKQDATAASVDFDAEGIADYFDDMVDKGYHPEQFGRIWLHTHPGFSASPSNTDEDTFKDAFGSCQWAIMLILGKPNVYARLQYNIGPKIPVELALEVDFTVDFERPDFTAWLAEYDKNIQKSYCYTPYRSKHYHRSGGCTVHYPRGRTAEDLAEERQKLLTEGDEDEEEKLSPQEQLEERIEQFNGWLEDYMREDRSEHQRVDHPFDV